MEILAQLNLSPETKRASARGGKGEKRRKEEFAKSHYIFKNKIWERTLHEKIYFSLEKQVLFHVPHLLARE